MLFWYDSQHVSKFDSSNQFKDSKNQVAKEHQIEQIPKLTPTKLTNNSVERVEKEK